MTQLGIILRKTITCCSSVLWARHEKALSVCSRWDGKVPMRMRTMLLPKAIPVSQTCPILFPYSLLTRVLQEYNET
jgi:hypothetical protein